VTGEVAALRTIRISHPGISGANTQATIRFYTELLGMELVLRQPNLDYEPEDHFLFHVGNHNFIAYFLPRDEAAATYEQASSGSGHMDHLAIDVDGESLDEAMERLRAAGVAFEGPMERGYERSIYFKDPNDVTIELLAWHTPAPEGMSQADILKRAQALREARGARIIEDEDIRRAIEDLSAAGH
jgi:catechol 2,3-dioxygenase-like lactoylglutathione lyase family enzyme